jgi:hypothetical protein
MAIIAPASLFLDRPPHAFDTMRIDCELADFSVSFGDQQVAASGSYADSVGLHRFRVDFTVNLPGFQRISGGPVGQNAKGVSSGYQPDLGVNLRRKLWIAGNRRFPRTPPLAIGTCNG